MREPHVVRNLVGNERLRPVRDADADLGARIERALRREREAAAALRKRIRQSDELCAQAAQKLASFESALERTRATLRGMGYLDGRHRT